MKISRYILKTVLIVIAAALATGCERNVNPADQEAATANVRLVFSQAAVPGSRALDYSGPQSGLTVKTGRFSASTRADEELDVIDNVWVLQFGPSGTQLVAPVYLSGSQLQSAPTESTDEAASYKLDVSLMETSECTLWFVGNTGNSSLFSQSLTLDAFMGMTISLTDESDVARHINKVSGSYTGAVDKSTVINVPMYRLVSKISFDVTYNDPLSNDPNSGLLKLKTLQLRSVPKTISYAGGTGADYRFPVIASGDPDSAWSSGFMDYEPVYFDDLRNLGTVTWYVPENIRGTNSAVTSELKKWSRSDPSWNSPRSYATHIVMEGDYEYTSGEATVKGMAEVTIYPGDNVVNDFNVARNSHYIINAGISKLQGWELTDYDDPLKDNRITVRTNPYITYAYYFEGIPDDLYWDSYRPMGNIYRWEDVTLGGSYSTTPEIRNALKDRTPDPDNFQDGRVEDGKEPLVASADNNENVVKIFYDKVQVAPGFYVHYYPNYPDGTGNMIVYGPYVQGNSYQVKPGFVLGLSYPGYGQRGYNTEPDGSGITYMEGDFIVLDSDVNLYAQWQKDN